MQHLSPSVAQTVKQYKKASADLRRQIQGNPNKARDFLLDAGILVKCKSSPSGVKLAKRFRSGE